jgi:hypothetical protein
MIVTFNGLQDQVLRHLAEATNTNTDVLALVKDLLNQSHQERLSAYPWPFMLWDTVESFSTTEDTQTYPLHQEFARPLYFYNATKKHYLREVPVRQIGPEGYRPNDDTGAEFYTLWGRTFVKYQPTSASAITIVSSSALDTGSDYALIIKGVDTSGVVRAEQVNPTGTTPIQTSISYTKILAITKARQWNGTLTVTSNSSAVTNLTLHGCEMGRSYQQLYLLGNPPTGDSIEYRFYRQPLVLINDYDIPEIPPAHCQIMVWDTLCLLAGYNTDIPPQALQTWRQQQARTEANLIEASLEAQSMEAQPRYVRDLDTDARLPAAFRL